MTTGGRRAGIGRRGQRGAVPPRVLLALAASCAVTVAVSGPMAYQAYEARSTDDRPPTTKVSGQAPPSVLPRTTERDRPSVALGPETTLDTTLGPDTTTTGAADGGNGQIDPGPTAPRSGTTAPRPAPTTARPATTIPRVPSTTVAPTTVVTTPPTTTPPLNGDGILLASDRRLRNGLPLTGATVKGRIWIYVAAGGVDVVRFWLDDPNGTGPPLIIDLDPPFSLVRDPGNDQPGSLDTTTLADGIHTVRTETTALDGSVTLHLARFTVHNAG